MVSRFYPDWQAALSERSMLRRFANHRMVAILRRMVAGESPTCHSVVVSIDMEILGVQIGDRSLGSHRTFQALSAGVFQQRDGLLDV